MVSVFPQLEQARVDYSWGGPVDVSMDRPVHAREQDGLFYSVGYSGHGVQMATHMGKQMADYMDGDTQANPWRPDPSGRHRRVYCQLLCRLWARRMTCEFAAPPGRALLEELPDGRQEQLAESDPARHLRIDGGRADPLEHYRRRPAARHPAQRGGARGCLRGQSRSGPRGAAAADPGGTPAQ